MGLVLVLVFNILLLKLFVDVFHMSSQKKSAAIKIAQQKKVSELTGIKKEGVKDFPKGKLSLFPMGFWHFATSFWGIGTIIFFLLTLYSIFM